MKWIPRSSSPRGTSQYSGVYLRSYSGRRSLAFALIPELAKTEFSAISPRPTPVPFFPRGGQNDILAGPKGHPVHVESAETMYSEWSPAE